MQLDVPPARDLVPTVDDLPPGFGLERSEPQPYDHEGFVDGHFVELRKPGTPDRGVVRLHAGALVFEGPERAHDAFARLVALDEDNATRPALGDEARWTRASYVDPASRNMSSEQLVLREGVVVWFLASEVERKGDAALALDAVALRLLARVG